MPDYPDCPEQPEIRQTLFLGCSIQNFKCSLGWNESASTLSARIIRDTCTVDPADDPKIYYDENLNKQFTRDPDPGFKIYGEAGNQPPEIGAPCYFRFGDFEFCGLLQSWQQADSATDTDIYDVVLSAPTDLLQGVSLILSEYAGPVRGFNIFNVYAFQEHYNGYKAGLFTQFAEDGVLFGTSSSPLKDWSIAQPDGSIDASSGYGGASLTEAGMPWPKVRQAIDILTSRVPLIPSNFSEYGRVCYIGAARGGYGLLPYDDVNVELAGAFSYAKHISHYVLDLTDIPFAEIDYRIGGPTSDILSIISQVCQDLVHDYYVELVPVRYGGQILKVIKFRTVSRVNQPPKDIVKQYVEYLNNRGVIASSYGEELRNESSTNFIIGGKKKTIYQVYNGIPFAQADPDAAWLQTNFPNNAYVRDTIVPYYGKDYNGRPYIVYDEPTKVGGVDQNSKVIDVDLTGIIPSLFTIGQFLPPVVTVPVNQIEAATYSFDSWIGMLHWNDKQIRRGTHPGNKNINSLVDLLKVYAPNFLGNYGRALVMGAGVGSAQSIRDISATMGQTTTGQQVVKEFGDLYKIFQTMGQTALSTVMVRVPYVSAKVENGRIIASDFPCAGAWTEHNNILGIPNPGGYVDYLKNEDGSIPSIASYPFVSGLNVSQLEGTKHVYTLDENDNGVIYTTVDAEEEIVFLDPVNAISPRIIVNLPDISSLLKGPQELMQQEAAALNIALTFNTLPDPENTVNKFSSARNLIEPSGLAIAFESRENTYGPWKPSNVIEAGPPGRITVTKDESLVPWEYGGYQNMSLVAQQIANASVGGMNVGENGSITVDGIPNIPLGSELASIEGLGGGFYGGNRHLFENRAPLFRQVSTAQIDPYSLIPTTNSFQSPYINFGVWSNQYGPNITSIDTSFGDDGITTTYQFRTYSPRFGTLSKIKADQLGSRLKQYNKLLSQQRMLGAANELRLRSKTGSGRSAGGGGGGRRGAASANAKAATSEKNVISRNSSTIEDLKDYEAPASVLMGNMRPFDITGFNGSGNFNNNAFRESGVKKRTLVSSKDVPSAARDLNNSGYDSTAMMSWDGLIRPVSLTGTGGLPRMAVPSISGNIEGGTITSRLLNFLSNPSGLAFSDLTKEHTGNAGHDIDMVARSSYSSYTGTGSGCSFGLPISTNFTSGTLVFDYADDYRFFALRGPLFIHGWGYDTDGNPVPNQSDIEGSLVSGDFSNTSLVKKFYPNWLRRPDTWPAAPMDLRFDRKRGVWVAGGGGGGSDHFDCLILEDIKGNQLDVPNKRIVTRRAKALLVNSDLTNILSPGLTWNSSRQATFTGGTGPVLSGEGLPISFTWPSGSGTLEASVGSGEGTFTISVASGIEPIGDFLVSGFSGTITGSKLLGEIDLEPRILGSFPIDSAQTCGCSDRTILNRRSCDFQITTPIMGAGIVDSGSYNSVVIRGSGANPQSTVLVTMNCAAGSPIVNTVTVDNEGIWTTAPLNLYSAWIFSGFGTDISMPVQVIAKEILVSGFEMPEVFGAFTLRSDIDTTLPSSPASPPILVDDLGSSSQDNVTSSLRPTFSGRRDVPSNIVMNIYVNGIYNCTSSDPATSAILSKQIVTDLTDPGFYWITYTLLTNLTDVNSESGHSPPLLIERDPGQSFVNATADANYKVRFGWGSIKDGRYILNGADPCFFEPEQSLQLYIKNLGLQ